MVGPSITCPGCRQALPVPELLPAQIHCHRCGMGVWATGETMASSHAAADPPPAMGILVPAATAEPSVLGSDFSQGVYPRRPRPRNELVLAGIATGGILLLSLTVMLVLLCLRTPERNRSHPVVEDPATSEPAPALPVAVTSAPVSSPDEVALSCVKAGPIDDDGFVCVGKRGLAPPVAIKLVTFGYPGVDQSKVEDAIAHGVAYLKTAVAVRGNTAGHAGLAGLTLLSCGVPASDAAVVRHVRTVREKGPNLRATYDMAVAILFLDRLGEPRDEGLIRSLALRLTAGQGVTGGWGYTCSELNQTQEKELAELVNRPTKTAAKILPRQKTFARPAGQRTMKDLPVFQFQPGQTLAYRPGPHEDNSLTQFAILALWSAQKHGVAADRSLAMAAARFRASQAEDGSWCYTWRDLNRCKYSMTCAGLLGLAAGRGSERRQGEGKMSTADPAIEKALRFVSQEIGTDHVAVWLKSKTGAYNDGASGWGGLYFLWSLERAAVVYDLRTIGGKDWYAWGAPIILAAQKADGSWRDTFPGVPDTCFALLFLRRTNVVQDLTEKIQFLTMSKSVGVRLRESESEQDLSFGRRSEFSGDIAPGRVRGLRDAP